MVRPMVDPSDAASEGGLLGSEPPPPPAGPHQVAAGCRRTLVTGSPTGSRIWTLVSGVGTAVAPGW